jgi:fatty acid desaturase
METSSGNLKRVLLSLTWNWFAIAFGYWCYFNYPSPGTFALCIVLSGIHLHRLAIFGHDAAHFLFSKNHRLNDLLANIFCYYPLGATVAGYRPWHLEHHRYVGTDRDPELVFKSGRLYQLPVSRKTFARRAIFDMIGAGTIEILKLLNAIRPRTLRDFLGLSVYWAAMAAAAVYFHKVEILAMHMVSIFSVFWMVFRIRNFSEHIGTTTTHRFSASPLWAYLVFGHNTFYHFEHHSKASVPAHLLPELRTQSPSQPVLSLTELFDLFATGTAHSDSPKDRKAG